MANISKIKLHGVSYDIKDATARSTADAAKTAASTAQSTADAAKTTAMAAKSAVDATSYDSTSETLLLFGGGN